MLPDFQVTLQTLLGNQLQADGSQRKVVLTGRVYLTPHGLQAENGI